MMNMDNIKREHIMMPCLISTALKVSLDCWPLSKGVNCDTNATCGSGRNIPNFERFYCHRSLILRLLNPGDKTC